MSAIPSSTWFTVGPDWGWLIVFYFFFGALAGGCYFLAALIDVCGKPEDRPLARLGYYVVLPCLMVNGVLLIVDLSRPDRFWHMLIQANTLQPMFKYWTPMSTASWVLVIFSAFAVLSCVAALSEAGRLSWRWPLRLRPPGVGAKVFAAVGALFALYITGYTGVLLALTNRPLWSDTPLLGMLLLISATLVSIALLLLLARWQSRTPPAMFALNRMIKWLIVLELLVLTAVVATLGAVTQAWLNRWGLLLLLGVVGLGLIVPLLLQRRDAGLAPGGTVAAAVLIVAGDFILRTVIVFTPESIHL